MLNLTDLWFVRIAIALCWLGLWVAAAVVEVPLDDWPIGAVVALWIVPQLLLGFLVGRVWTLALPVVSGLVIGAVWVADCQDPGTECSGGDLAVIAVYVLSAGALVAAGYWSRLKLDRWRG